jgi:hypothetical protein
MYRVDLNRARAEMDIYDSNRVQYSSIARIAHAGKRAYCEKLQAWKEHPKLANSVVSYRSTRFRKKISPE